jgi:hypothetical protein
MTVSVADFRAAFPAFADATKYPDAAVQFWLDTAYAMLPPLIWDTSLDLGVQLYTAHNLIMDQRAAAAGASGSGGVVASKSVKGVSIGYDTGLGLAEGAGAYGATTYGNRFYQMMVMFGAGGVQL